MHHDDFDLSLNVLRLTLFDDFYEDFFLSMVV